jgi:glutaredoxin
MLSAKIKGDLMGTVKIFYKDGCPMCPMAKRLKDNLQENNVDVHYYNVETADGLAEATFYRVLALPTILVEDEMENGLGEWRGIVPKVEEVLHVVQGL